MTRTETALLYGAFALTLAAVYWRHVNAYIYRRKLRLKSARDMSGKLWADINAALDNTDG